MDTKLWSFLYKFQIKEYAKLQSFFNLSQCIIVNPLRCVRNAAKNVLSSKKSMGSLCENFFRNIDSFSSEKVHYAIIKINWQIWVDRFNTWSTPIIWENSSEFLIKTTKIIHKYISIKANSLFSYLPPSLSTIFK